MSPLLAGFGLLLSVSCVSLSCATASSAAAFAATEGRIALDEMGNLVIAAPPNRSLHIRTQAPSSSSVFVDGEPVVTKAELEKQLLQQRLLVNSDFESRLSQLEQRLEAQQEPKCNHSSSSLVFRHTMKNQALTGPELSTPPAFTKVPNSAFVVKPPCNATALVAFVANTHTGSGSELFTSICVNGNINEDAPRATTITQWDTVTLVDTVHMIAGQEYTFEICVQAFRATASSAKVNGGRFAVTLFFDT